MTQESRLLSTREQASLILICSSNVFWCRKTSVYLEASTSIEVGQGGPVGGELRYPAAGELSRRGRPDGPRYTGGSR